MRPLAFVLILVAAPPIHCYETAGSSGAQTSITVPKPGSGSTAGPDGAKAPVAGDYLVVILGAEVNNPSNFFQEADRPDSSWSFEAYSGNSTSDCAVALYFHKVDGNEGDDFTFGTWAANDCWAICILVSGGHENMPDASHGAWGHVVDSSPPLAVTGDTTTVDDCIVLVPWAFDGGDDGGFAVSGTGWTKLTEARNGTGSGNASGGVAYRKMSGQGATGTCTIDPSVSDGMAGFQFAIAPAAGGSPQTLTPGSITTEEAFGSQKANLSLAGAGAIGSGEVFGSERLNLTLLGLGAVASGETFGALTVDLSLVPSGISSAEAFGAHTLSTAGEGPQTLTPLAIASAEAFGAAALDLALVPVGIVSAEVFGATRLGLLLVPSGVQSAEAFGQALLAHGIEASAIAGAEAFGAARLALVLFPAAIQSEEAVGTHTISGGLVVMGVLDSEGATTESGPRGAVAASGSTGETRAD